MAMLQVLTEVICTEEFLGLVTLAKFVHVVQVFSSRFPACRVGKLFSAKAANVGHCWASG
jgi:hypothetical protein